MSHLSQTPYASSTLGASVAPPLCPMARMNGLPITDRLVVLAIRAWVEAVRNDLPPSAAARAAFGAVGMADVASLIHALMTAVAYGARRPLDIARPCAARLTDDESLLLDAIALGRASVGVDPALALRPLLSLAACRSARHLCAELANALAHAGTALDDRLARLARRPPPSAGQGEPLESLFAADAAGSFLQPI